jgi:hypothetical protein
METNEQLVMAKFEGSYNRPQFVNINDDKTLHLVFGGKREHFSVVVQVSPAKYEDVIRLVQVWEKYRGTQEEGDRKVFSDINRRLMKALGGTYVVKRTPSGFSLISKREDNEERSQSGFFRIVTVLGNNRVEETKQARMSCFGSFRNGAIAALISS